MPERVAEPRIWGLDWPRGRSRAVHAWAAQRLPATPAVEISRCRAVAASWQRAFSANNIMTGAEQPRARPVTGQPVWCHGCMAADDTTVLTMPSGEAVESLALSALDWLLGSARSTETGLTWAVAVPGAEPNFTLYHGAAGIVLALLEAR